jgi:hypothetical protein
MAELGQSLHAISAPAQTFVGTFPLATIQGMSPNWRVATRYD